MNFDPQEYKTLLAIEQHGDLNPIQRDRLAQYKQAYGAGGQFEDPAAKSQRLIQTAIDAYNQKLDDYNKKYSDYEKANPFVFDTVLAEERTKAKQRLDPYYEQTLGDYLQGVNTQRQRGLTDERQLLGEIQQDQDQLTGEKKIMLDDALEQTRQGAADAGLYDSGRRLRAEGKLQAQNNTDLASNMVQSERRANQVQTTTGRQQEDLALQESQKRRDLTQEQSYNVEAQALPAVQQRQSQRQFEEGQYTGAPPGVDTTTYTNSLYNLLK